MRTPTFLGLLSLCLLSPLCAKPQWIWSAAGGNKDKEVIFKRQFKVPAGAGKIILDLTCDNGADALINGKKVLSNPDWQQPSSADITGLLRKDGVNEIVVQARNKGGVAALVARLKAQSGKGQPEVFLETDAQWQVASKGSQAFAPATIIEPYGKGPWGLALDKPGGGAAAESGDSLAADEIGVAKGFKVEKLYNVPKAEQGSWVALCADDKGRLIACDQYGALYRMSVPALGSKAGLQPQRLEVELGKAHGLLHAFGSLYVMVNEDGKNNGLYRLRDSDGNDSYDKVDKLLTMQGGGEHGLHSMVLSPDGKRIYFNCGNHSKLPEGIKESRAPMIWGEDHIVPRLWDANGHARGILAPGGYICSMLPDGADLELFCYGFRNEFDICFDLGGSLFTYDADMEWDIGTPWYRPTRVNHCVSGADYGWRSGSGKWPNGYPDSLPTTLDIGPGSPTGVVSGKGAKFPAKYQRAVFINDWTYGTMWAIHLQPKGGSYVAQKEEFVFGKPLPLTDLIIHPQDGAMYFAVGGRRTQSGIYRVTYAGDESTAAAQPLPLDEEFRMREALEAFHRPGSDLKAGVQQAFSYLGHSDRHVRYAARVILEKAPLELWRDKALALTQPAAKIEALVALARVSRKATAVQEGGKPKSKPSTTSSEAVGPVAADQVGLQKELLAAWNTLPWDKLNAGQQMAAVRALQLIVIRLGKPGPETCAEVCSWIEPHYPSKDVGLNRELCGLLSTLESKKVPALTLGLMATAADDFVDVASDAVLSRNEGYANAARAAAGSRPNAQQIAYMYNLRDSKAGWTPELRRTYFSWFARARTWKGGNSFKGFIENIRKDAMGSFVPEAERAELEALGTRQEPVVAAANYVAPKGPGRAWSLDESLATLGEGLKGRNFAQGEAMYRSTMCATCHRFNGEGGSIGPDLTGSGNRYTLRDLMENIIDPSRVISDQYDSHEIRKKDGSQILGRIVVEENGKVFVMTNPFAPADLAAINESEIAEKQTRKVSMMPPGLINSLNADELKDLVAYLLSGGNPSDSRFSPSSGKP